MGVGGRGVALPNKLPWPLRMVETRQICQQALKQLETEIQTAKQEVVVLNQRNEALKTILANTSDKIDTVAKEQIATEQRIVQTQIAIAKLKKEQKTGIWKTLAVVGACALGSWWAQSFLANTSIGVSIFPSSGGARALITIAL